MKKIIFTFAIFYSFFTYGQVIDSIFIDSKIMNDKRRILIYVPDSYKYNPGQRYEVTYVFDAQSRMYFDFVHATQDFLAPENQTIVVGISSTFNEAKLQSRNSDFLPKPLHNDPKTYYNGYLGNADNFAKFVKEEVIAYIEKKYRTLPFRIGVGHSNGATFVMYNMLTDSLFDANLLLSPNLAYDNEQLVDKLVAAKPEKLAGKFVYMCNGNEDFAGWIAAREKTIPIFEKYPGITFYNDDFSKTDSHMTCFPPGFISGWKHYIDFKFHTAAVVIPYYKKLDQEKKISLTPGMLNNMAYGCLNANKTNDAIQILDWALVKFPDDINLYDSMGEMHQKVGNKAEALKYYKLGAAKIESQKSKLEKDKYEELKKGAEGRIAYLTAH